ncbi:ABC transporter substrate-binding protein [Oceanotoga teriensis]|uniref:Peptide/nickel transport system substrate-binding protein n=1 Tax=Oceanotoga teriensis TaxID=515440 RepID=A0AA45HI12_9BACT|nr:ABC transporter substrate-binding protein [Oceanotoga teriensis]MDO7976554.1 ABC transporter substrate-binding protein [Oceanotoga teriensis]PWJ88279.1 peptide/nickel transport system substrate-binding protein [Oceanotoga teriensis]
MKKVFLFISVLSIMIFSFSSNIVIRVPQDPDFLDPHKAAASGTYEMMFNVFEGLLKPSPDGKVIPAVAESYTVSDDGLEYTFKLRKNIKFHNGEIVTVEDVLYSLNRLKGNDKDSALSSDFQKYVESIDSPDSQTIKVRLNTRNSDFLVKFVAAIVPKKVNLLNDNPIGTGPYSFVEYVPGQKLVLKKFADYWGEKAHIDNVVFKIIPDEQTSLLSFLSGDIRMYPRINDIQAEMLKDRYNVIKGEQNMVQLMTMNNKVKPFDDKRVRQAINYAIDKDEIIQLVANGNGTKLGSNMSPIMKEYYEEGLEDYYKTDLNKAKQLLKDAGYSDGFTTTITVPSNYKFHVDTAQVIAEQLKKIGVNVEIKQVEWGVWLDEVYSKRNYDMTIIGLTGKLSPYDILRRYLSDYPKNFYNYENLEYDEIINKAISETNEDIRAALYKQAQIILTEDAAAVYIMDPQLTVVTYKEIKGYTMYPLYVQDISKLYYEK